jgi:hypothetical protein
LNWFLLLLLLFFVGTSAAAAVNASAEIESISASLVPVRTLQANVIECLGASTLPPLLTLARDLRAVTAEFQTPLIKILHLEQSLGRAPSKWDCQHLVGSLRDLTTDVHVLTTAVYRYEPAFVDQASIDRIHMLQRQITADFDKFRAMASNVCPWTNQFELENREFGWLLRFNGYLSAPTNVWALLALTYTVFCRKWVVKKVKGWFGFWGEAEGEKKSKTPAAAAPPPPPPAPPAAAPAIARAAAPAAPAPAASKGGKKKRRRKTESARS